MDLLAFQGGDAFPLGAVDLAEGTYTELRLVLNEAEPAKVVLPDGAEQAMFVPSGDESGLKVKTSFEAPWVAG